MKKLVKKVITAVFAVAMMMGLMSISAFAKDKTVTVTVKWDAAAGEDMSVWCWGEIENYTTSKVWPGDAMTANTDGTWTITFTVTDDYDRVLGFIASCNYGQTIDLRIPSTGSVWITVDEEPNEDGKYCATVEYDRPEWEYEILNDQSVAINGYLGVDTEIVIPAEIDGYTVKSIAAFAFRNCTSLSSVTIPESVTYIGSYAFEDCTSLRSITIPESVIEIDDRAFYNCTSLSNITIPESVTDIGYAAFEGTKWLDNKRSENPYVVINGILIGIANTDDNIIIPEGVTKISDGVLPSTIKSISLPNSFKTIEERFLWNYSSLESIFLSAGVEVINEDGSNVGLFLGCSSLNSIIVDESNSNYSSYNGCLYSKDMKVLYRCPQAVSSVVLHPFTEEIANGGFRECDKITEITLPANIKRLGWAAFYGCTELTTIAMTTIAKTGDFISLEANTFIDCNKFSTIEIPQTSQMYVINNGCLYSKDMTRLVMVPVANNNVILQDGLKVIGRAALANNTSEKIIIPDTVTLIEEAGIYTYFCYADLELIFKGDAPEFEEGAIGGADLIKFNPSPRWRSLLRCEGDYEYNCFYYGMDVVYFGIGHTLWGDDFVFTGLFEATENKIYYFKDGRLDKTFNGIAAYGDKYYVVKDGRVVSEVTDSWISDSRGWKYQNADGTFAKNCWKAINSKWYYFDGEGYMQTGWKQINGSWYYFETSGAMATGWLQDGNKWYYLETTGKMATGWKQISGSWYYFESNGVMTANKWVNSVYYMKSDGAMAVNEWVDGGRYYVDSNGKWVPNKTKASWKKDAKGWWYDNGDGTYPKSAWKSIDGSWYYFNNSGYMVTGWLNDGGKWYYLESSGRMASSKWIGGTYYVKSNGVMATNEWVDGGRYYVDANGKWVANKTA